MTVSTSALLKGHYDATRALGLKAISSDFAIEIEGFENIWLKCKQFPWPVTSSAGEIEVPMPLGAMMYQSQQLKIAHQGQVTFFEDVAGSVDQTLINLITKGGTFNAKVYEGTPQQFLRVKRIVDCFFQVDDPDRDWENRAQVLSIAGTVFYHYFGEIGAGNSNDYR